MKPLGKSFAVLTKNYIGMFTRKLSDIDIERYFYVTYVLHEAREPMCQKDIAEKVNVDTVTMVRMVDYLIRKGMVNKVRSKRDRRYYLLELTAKAHKIMPLIIAAYRETDDQCFGNFTKSERKEFNRLLMKMLDNIGGYPKDEVVLSYREK